MKDFGFQTLDFDKQLILWVSGGRDSTAMALALFEYIQKNKITPNVLLITTRTWYNKLENMETVAKLSSYTGFKHKYIYYQGTGNLRAGKIMNMSFKTIPRALEAKIHEGCLSYKKYFLCCKLLKHKPAKDYLKNIPVGTVINFIGFKKADKAIHRKGRMNELRKWDTFFRNLTEFYDHSYFYPLRDVEAVDIVDILTKHGFENISSSGCRICPNFLISDWSKKDPDSDKKSKHVADKLGVDSRPEKQTGIKEFIDIDTETEEILEIEKDMRNKGDKKQ